MKRKEFCVSFSIEIPCSMFDDTLKHLNASRIVLLLLQFNATALPQQQLCSNTVIMNTSISIFKSYEPVQSPTQMFSSFEHQSLSGVHTKRVQTSALQILAPILSASISLHLSITANVLYTYGKQRSVDIQQNPIDRTSSCKFSQSFHFE